MRRMNLRPCSRRTLAISLVLVLAAVSVGQRRPQTSEPKRPRLVLLIVVDQFRYDYLERFGDLFVANGLRRLLREGASWTQSNYDHMPTYTAPGHATMMTGAYPAESGIIGNEWLDRASGFRITSVSDEHDKTPRRQPKRERSQSTPSHGFDCRRRTATRNQRPLQSHWHFSQGSLSNSSRWPQCQRRILVEHRDRQHGVVNLLLQRIAGLGHCF